MAENNFLLSIDPFPPSFDMNGLPHCIVFEVFLIFVCVMMVFKVELILFITLSFCLL